MLTQRCRSSCATCRINLCVLVSSLPVEIDEDVEEFMEAIAAGRALEEGDKKDDGDKGKKKEKDPKELKKEKELDAAERAKFLATAEAKLSITGRADDKTKS